MHRWLAGLLLGLLLVLLVGRGAAWAEDPVVYRLGSGDEVRVTVFGEDDLTGTYSVDGSGRLALPLIGSVEVGGLSLRAAETLIHDRFAADYLRNPRIALEVLSYRPFYILGEVRTPGHYPYAEGLTVMGAVAVGGGFSYRADEDDIEITRGGAAPRVVPLEAPVLPGDVIRVNQRFF